MRIAVWHNLPSGGAKRALYDHVRGLVQRGHTVESWCPPTSDLTYLPLSELVPEHVVPSTALPESSRYTPANILGLNTYNLRRLKEVDHYAKACAAEINRGGFDLLFANTSLDVAISSIGRYVDLPRVLYLQDTSRWLYEARPKLIWANPSADGHQGLTRPIYALRDAIRVRGFQVQAREEWTNARTFDAILVNSHFSREIMLHTYGVDARVCYLSIDSKKFQPGHLQKENYVVGVGAIAPHKNIRLVIQALGLVPAPRPRLVWIGDVARPEYLDSLKALANDSQVDFEPLISVTDETLIETLHRALMMVYAPRLEPFGFAPLEANACGLPVVAVAEGGLRETIQNGVNGLLVDHDAKALADAIEYLITHPDYAAKLGENGVRLVVENWSLDAATDRLERHFRSVLGSKRAHGNQIA